MAVKAYGSQQMGVFTCAKRVLMTCHELGVKYELDHIDLLKGEHKNLEYIANMQPFGSIPVLIDEDATRIFESRAIARCLVAKYGKDSTLVPSPADPKAYGLFEQEASIEYSSFDPTASGVYLENLHARIEDREPDTTLVEKNCQALLAKFEAYDRVLSKQKYLGGDVFALADLFHIPYGKAIQSYAPGTFDSQPNVERWWAEITARESWKAVADLR